MNKFIYFLLLIFMLLSITIIKTILYLYRHQYIIHCCSRASFSQMMPHGDGASESSEHLPPMDLRSSGRRCPYDHVANCVGFGAHAQVASAIGRLGNGQSELNALKMIFKIEHFYWLCELKFFGFIKLQ